MFHFECARSWGSVTTTRRSKQNPRNLHGWTVREIPSIYANPYLPLQPPTSALSKSPIRTTACCHEDSDPSLERGTPSRWTTERLTNVFPSFWVSPEDSERSEVKGGDEDDNDTKTGEKITRRRVQNGGRRSPVGTLGGRWSLADERIDPPSISHKDP